MGAVASNIFSFAHVLFQNGRAISMRRVFDSPSSSKFLINENAMYLHFGIHVHTPSASLIFDNGDRMELNIMPDGRFWFWLFFPVTNEDIPPTQEETLYSVESQVDIKPEAQAADATLHRSDATISRWEAVTGAPWPFKDRPIYPFGCRVLVLRDKPDRGPAGGPKGRSYEGRWLGYTSDLTAMIVRKDSGQIMFTNEDMASAPEGQ